MNSVIDYAKAAVANAWMNSIGSRGEFSGLKEKTAMVFPGVVPVDVCAELMARIDAMADQPDHPRVWRDPVGSDTRILGFEQDMEDHMKHFDVERKIHAVDAYTGFKTRSWFLMANRVLPKESNLGSGGGLHRDSPFSHQVKCIWYLSDVTSQTGPFQYIPGTHSNLFKKRATYPVGKSRFDSVEDELVEAHAKAGSLLVCDTKCIHGGKPIDSGSRYAVTLYTMPKEDGVREIFRKNGVDQDLAPRHSVAA